MRFFLFILATIAVVAGVMILNAAQSAIHEIEGFLLVLISSVLLIGAAVVDAIVNARARLEPLVKALVTNTERSDAPEPASGEDFSG